MEIDILGVKVNVEEESATNFDYRISKSEAERLVNEYKYELPFDVMCKEYGEDEDWVGMNIDDINEDTKMFDDDYLTFEIWYMPEVIKVSIHDVAAEINKLKL